MKECPSCQRSYPDANRFCPVDGISLVESAKRAGESELEKRQRNIPAPPEPLPMRLTIIDQENEGHRSRVIQGLVLDTGQQGMRIQTGTIETGHLNIIRDHTIAFKNKLEIEVDLPTGTVKCTGFAAWYKPVGDGINWVAGIYIRDMPASDRRIYDEYLQELSKMAESEGAVAESNA